MQKRVCLVVRRANVFARRLYQSRVGLSAVHKKFMSSQGSTKCAAWWQT